MSLHVEKKMIFGHQRQGSDSAAFKELTKKDAQTQLAVELEKLLRTYSDGNSEIIEREFKGFRHLFNRFLLDPKSIDGLLHWEKIEKLPDGAVCDYQMLPTPQSSEIRKMLDQLVVVKLNGGLGT